MSHARSAQHRKAANSVNHVSHAKVDAVTAMAAATIDAVNAQKAAHLKAHHPKTVLSILKRHHCCQQKASHRQAPLASRVKNSASHANAAAATVTAATAANAVKVGSALNAPMVASNHSRSTPLRTLLKQHPPQHTKNARSQSLK